MLREARLCLVLLAVTERVVRKALVRVVRGAEVAEVVAPGAYAADAADGAVDGVVPNGTLRVGGARLAGRGRRRVYGRAGEERGRGIGRQSTTPEATTWGRWAARGRCAAACAARRRYRRRRVGTPWCRCRSRKGCSRRESLSTWTCLS
jgi:hypothetical protein